MKPAAWMVSLALLAQPVASRAETPAPPTPGAELYAAGHERYVAGDFAAAARLFEDAYAVDADPVYLFNAAQAHRFAKHCGLAARFYRRFLEAVPTAPSRAKIEGYIHAMDACTPPAPAPTMIADRPPTPAPGRTQRLVALGVGAVGVLAVGTGVYFTREVGRIEDERAGLCVQVSATQCRWTGAPGEDTALDREGRRAQRNGAIAYGLGAAALGGALALYLLAPRARETAQLAIAPASTGAMVFGVLAF